MSHKDLTYLVAGCQSHSIPLPAELRIAWEKSDDAWCLKDRERKIVFVNEKYYSLIAPDNRKGESAFSCFRHYIICHDNRVIDEERKIEAFGVLPTIATSEFAMFQCERMPFYNATAHMIGIMSHVTPLGAITPNFFVSGEGVGTFSTCCPLDIFSEREWVVAFLLLLGLSEKEAAEKLNRTLRTIKFHKSNILQKTYCATTREFIQLARRNKWQFAIPHEFAKPCYIIR
ncbi:hypothetical protein ED28_09085 [[Pantoea] beijingensis]|uniref:HTH luxR-type domain-containing protein n=1 Tax=[Pantoea] beijingensis TaxID=1324864 RepID=A0A443IDM1_9GAMM|nr:LuxR C-terminal-related transcriptional regulator [[Pantoea] beijingensis]RWR02214.1 hypothetical protein ED28_09085 [[Pantoea] beijingensis]